MGGSLHSISLVGFRGWIASSKVTSGSVLLWRMSVGCGCASNVKLNERRALRFVGVCFLLLAVYLGYESGVDLLLRVLLSTVYLE